MISNHNEQEGLLLAILRQCVQNVVTYGKAAYLF